MCRTKLVSSKREFGTILMRTMGASTYSGVRHRETRCGVKRELLEKKDGGAQRRETGPTRLIV